MQLAQKLGVISRVAWQHGVVEYPPIVLGNAPDFVITLRRSKESVGLFTCSPLTLCHFSVRQQGWLPGVNDYMDGASFSFFEMEGVLEGLVYHSPCSNPMSDHLHRRAHLLILAIRFIGPLTWVHTVWKTKKGIPALALDRCRSFKRDDTRALFRRLGCISPAHAPGISRYREILPCTAWRPWGCQGAL